MQEMVSQRFLVLLGVENNILVVYQNPPIRKLNRERAKREFQSIIGMNDYLSHYKTIV